MSKSPSTSPDFSVRDFFKRFPDDDACLEHLMEYEDCVIDVNSEKKQLLMPTWPTLWPRLLDGKTNERLDTRPKDMVWGDNN